MAHSKKVLEQIAAGGNANEILKTEGNEKGHRNLRGSFGDSQIHENK
jgi:hypothetical protein